MNRYASLAALVCAGLLSACDKNTVQVLPTADLAGAQLKFFNFGVNAPGVNFYADSTKMTAISSGTGQESTNGVTYGGMGAGGFYTALAPGQHTITGRIAAATDKNLPIASVTTTLADGKDYSFYMSGFYNTTTKTADAFVVEDPFTVSTDYTVAAVRFVHAIGNANPMTLYARPTGDTVTAHWAAVGAEVAYQGAGAFTTLPAGAYDLTTRYTGSATSVITRAAQSFLGGRVYTVTARGDITITSTTATNRPILDNTANY
jgi:hypothetical protein